MGAHLAWLALFDLAAHPILTVGIFFVAYGALAVAAVGLERCKACSIAAVLLVTIVLRFSLLPLPPTLSKDLWRYLWDGRVAAAGFNPYLLAPEAEELESLRDPLWERLDHREVPTVYPPLALGLFSIAARLPFPHVALKGFLAALDLAACLLLLRLAEDLKLPPARILWYAWSPLVTLEVAGMGHVEGLGGAAVVGTVLLLARQPPRAGAGGTLAAAGVLAKLVPLAALPMWSRQSGRPLRFLIPALGLSAVAATPVWVHTGGIPQGLTTYGVSWEFNGPLYEPLWRGLDRLGVSEGVTRGLDRLKEWIGWHETWNHLYPYAYPQFLAKLLLAGGVAAVLALSLKRRQPVPGTGWLFGTLLLFSATVYPWYLLWVLPWAGLCRQLPWLALPPLVVLSYLPQFTPVPLFPWLFLGIWVPFFVLLARWPRWSIA